MKILTWQNPGQLFVAQVLKKLLLLSPAYGIYFFDLDARDGFDDVAAQTRDGEQNEKNLNSATL